MLAESLARLDKCMRPFLVQNFPALATKIYSSGRSVFLSALCAERPLPAAISKEHRRTLWGLTFRNGLLNAAGMFKNAEGYELSFRQGAGGYLVGTTTARARKGNEKNGVRKPFMPYPRSQAASNWLGLPNDGHDAVAERVASFEWREDFPVGASLAASPDSNGVEALQELVRGMDAFVAAGANFLEINESCPNAAHGDSSLEAIEERLQYVAEHFSYRDAAPVVVKFSTDTPLESIEKIIDMLLRLGFSGVNFGNTSTDYALRRAEIDASEHEIFDYFTGTFGGGVSGKPIAASSLVLTEKAAKALAAKKRKRSSDYEFHIISVGGILRRKDFDERLRAGASLCQWYTGYFERFAEDGHQLYVNFFHDK
jgi:dihydroorotate dehydrogenase